MGETRRSGVRIRYRVAGSGPPLILVHGYTASGKTNWELTGWFEALGSRRTLLAPDLRGHGRSQKPYSASAYSIEALASDVLAVMDEEGVTDAPIFGYSMGGLVAMELLVNAPGRVNAAIIGGMGSYFPRGRGRFARERQHPGSAAPQRSLGERAKFLAAYAARFDPIAIEAVYRGVFREGRMLEAERLRMVQQPTLVVAGDKDAFFDPARTLARLLPHGRFVALENEGHLSAVRSPRFKDEVVRFLSEVERGGAARE